jgi:hypothetical protein
MMAEKARTRAALEARQLDMRGGYSGVERRCQVEIGDPDPRSAGGLRQCPREVPRAQFRLRSDNLNASCISVARERRATLR